MGFWAWIKILATTLGETGGDSVSMTWLGETTAEAGQGGLNGYLVGTAIFGVLLIVLVVGADPGAALQSLALLGDNYRLDHRGHDTRRLCRPLARHRLPRRLAAAPRPASSLSLFAWYRTTGTIRQLRRRPARGDFYWITITFSQTLGTALGDWRGLRHLAIGRRIGVRRGAAVLAALYFWTNVSRVILFWAASSLPARSARRSAISSDQTIANGGLAMSLGSIAHAGALAAI